MGLVWFAKRCVCVCVCGGLTENRSQSFLLQEIGRKKLLHKLGDSQNQQEAEGKIWETEENQGTPNRSKTHSTIAVF